MIAVLSPATRLPCQLARWSGQECRKKNRARPVWPRPWLCLAVELPNRRLRYSTIPETGDLPRFPLHPLAGKWPGIAPAVPVEPGREWSADQAARAFTGKPM